ncbi:MAG: hypothetical protein AB7O49_14080 [Sphingomonadales bacterium]
MKLIEKRTAAMMASPKAAREILIKEGIYTKKGELRTEFGGPKKTKAA